jgi:hypothetical protein
MKIGLDSLNRLIYHNFNCILVIQYDIILVLHYDKKASRMGGQNQRNWRIL